MNNSWGAIVAALAALSGILLGWSGRSREARREDRGEAASAAALRADMEYIKRGVDEIKQELKAQGNEIDVLRERMTKAEENSKSTRHRLDRLEENETRC